MLWWLAISAYKALLAKNTTKGLGETHQPHAAKPSAMVHTAAGAPSLQNMDGILEGKMLHVHQKEVWIQ